MRGLNIAIVGAGIGGLCAGAALSAAGNDVIIYEQFDVAKPVGSGLLVQPVGQAVLDLINAGDAAKERGATINRMIGHDEHRSWPVLDVAYDPNDATGNYGLAIHRAALFQLLFDAAKRDGVRFETGRKVAGINNYHTRKLRFEDGSESPVYDLVIDAAGASSPLSPLKARALAYGAIWGTVDWPEDCALPRDQLSQRYSKAARMAGVLPIGTLPSDNTQKAAIFWSLRQDAHQPWLASPLTEWRETVTEFWPAAAPFFNQITRHSQMTAAFYSHGTLSRATAPGLVHIGDAAHRTSPQLGQGANMALLDAYALAMAVDNCDSLRAALKAYGRIRSRHLKLYQAISRVFTPFYQSDNKALPFVRDFVLAPASRVPPVQKLLSRIVCGDLVEPLREGVLH